MARVSLLLLLLIGPNLAFAQGPGAAAAAEKEVRAVIDSYNAAYGRNDLYFNMQELEYWDERPKYTGLPDDRVPADKQLDGEIQ